MGPGRAFALALTALLAVTAEGARAADEDMVMGAPTAPVTVIEYLSPTCPDCARFNAEVFPAFKARYLDTGRVRLVLREAPAHPNLDHVAFLLARCAGPARYYKVLDDLMRAQPEYFATDDLPEIMRRFDVALLREMQALGMSEAEGQACLADTQAAMAARARSQKELREVAIDGLPTFVIGGKKLTAPAGKVVDLSALDAAIAAASAPRLRR